MFKSRGVLRVNYNLHLNVASLLKHLFYRIRRSIDHSTYIVGTLRDGEDRGGGGGGRRIPAIIKKRRARQKILKKSASALYYPFPVF